MNPQDKRTPNADLIDTYRRQMMELYRHSAAPSPAAPAAEENWLDSRYPEPNVERDRAAIVLPDPPPRPQPEPAPPPRPQPEPAPPPRPQPEPTPEPAFVGYLRVFAVTGGGAEPLAGARVVVSRPEESGETVYANVTTDRDGFTPVIPLPSVDPALTLQPGTEKPYETYTIRVTADGFRPVEHQNVPVYGNNYVTQPVSLTPLLPGEDAENTQDFTSGGPTNL